MAKNIKMRRNSQELEYLTIFLNLHLGKLPYSFFTDYYVEGKSGRKIDRPASPEAATFAKKHDLLGSAELVDVQQDLLARLTDLIDPESLIPIRAAKAVREQFKREVVDKYMSNPERALARLVGHLNQIAIKSQWGL